MVLIICLMACGFIVSISSAYIQLRSFNSEKSNLLVVFTLWFGRIISKESITFLQGGPEPFFIGCVHELVGILTIGRKGHPVDPDATILTDCTPDMEIMNDEIFGPVMPISRVGSFD